MSDTEYTLRPEGKPIASYRDLEDLRAENARLREALAFYALEDWTWCLSDSEDRFKSPLALDRGQRARAALKERNE